MRRGSLAFGIVRSIDATRSRARLADLCELLTTDLGLLFVPHHPASYRECVESFSSGDLALAWLPPIACVTLEDLGRSKVLALPVRRGAVAYRSAIIAREAGPKSLLELRGKRMAWVDPESAAGYIVPRLFMQGSGVDLSALFAEERFLLSHAAVVDAVVGGRVDAGATYCAVDGPVGAPRGPWSASNAPIRVIATTGTIPNDAIVVSTELPAETRSKLLRWLLDLKGARAQKLCADLFGAESFRVAAGAHFEPLRRMLLAARASG